MKKRTRKYPYLMVLLLKRISQNRVCNTIVLNKLRESTGNHYITHIIYFLKIIERINISACNFFLSQKCSVSNRWVFREPQFSRAIFEKRIKWKSTIESQWIERSNFRAVELPWPHFNFERKAAISARNTANGTKNCVLRSFTGVVRQT